MGLNWEDENGLLIQCRLAAAVLHLAPSSTFATSNQGRYSNREIEPSHMSPANPIPLSLTSALYRRQMPSLSVEVAN